LENAGTYLYRRVRYEEAEPFFEQSLAVREND
jgi:Tfp pilus assembly protein PilF